MPRRKKTSKKIAEGLASVAGSIKAPELDLAAETKRSIAIIIFVILAGVVTLILLGSAGFLGGHINNLLLKMFGVIAYAVPAILLAIAWILFRHKPVVNDEEEEEEVKHPYSRAYIGMILLTAGLAGVIHLISLDDGQSAFDLAAAGRAGGYLGALVVGPLVGSLGFWAGGLIIAGILIIGLFIAFNFSPSQIFAGRRARQDAELHDKVTELKINAMQEVIDADPGDDDEEEAQEDKPPVINMAGEKSEEEEAVSKMESIILEDRKDWKLPPFSLLKDNKSKIDSGNIEANVEIIKKTLGEFGVKVEMDEVNVGPTVTQYTMSPAPGVKLQQIKTLSHNLALALSAKDIRLELPIPGKPLVGIEVPNQAAALVGIRDVMQTTDFTNNKGGLALALGRDVAGRPFVVDLAKMPHMLIAGTTGSGKSVAINGIIISLLYKNTPQDVKFIFVDPKHVELTPYNGIPHLLTPTITDPQKAINAFKWAVNEMERRYQLVASAGQKNIVEYNQHTELKLPYIVIVVDELANLMAQNKPEVEAAIVRLASLSRAVGIHLVLAAQRPSSEIITGLIKANVPTRIAFRLPTQVDSRTILDAVGAEKLLGNGDMLYVASDDAQPRRLQGTFVSRDEVQKVVDFFKQQAGAVIYNDEITEKPKTGSSIPGMSGGGDTDDELFEQAKEEVMRAGKASASLLQRRLRVGYARAARLLDLLEDAGIVGPADGSKPREVYGVSDAERSEYGIEDEDNY